MFSVSTFRVPIAIHYSNVIMSVIVSQITSVSIVCSNVCSGADQKIHLTGKMFPFNDAIVNTVYFRKYALRLYLVLFCVALCQPNLVIFCRYSWISYHIEIKLKLDITHRTVLNLLEVFNILFYFWISLIVADNAGIGSNWYGSDKIMWSVVFVA